MWGSCSGAAEATGPAGQVIPSLSVIHRAVSGGWPAGGPDRKVARMTHPAPVVLTLIADDELCASAERISAAVGAHPIRAEMPSRRNWLAAAAVVLDEQGALRCARAGLPRRDGVLLVGSEDPSSDLWAAAVDVGAQRLCALPAQEDELVRHLAEATETGPAVDHRGQVIAVLAGRGGAGASVFSAALALSAGNALLADLDPCGGGIDLLLGGESLPGLRWPDLRLQSGRLGWSAVRDVLPHRRGVSILSSTRSFHEIDPGAVTSLLEAGRRGGAAVVCDIPRQLTPAGAAALQFADLTVVVTSSDVRAVAATAAVISVVRTLNPAVGLVVRGPSPGGLSARQVADAAAAPLLAAMRPEPMLAQRLEQGGLRIRRRSPLGRAARTVLDVLTSNGRPS